MSKDFFRDFETGAKREAERRSLKQAQKTRQFEKRNRQGGKPRQRQWDADEFEDDEPLLDERIMPRDERERRIEIMQRARQVPVQEGDTPTELPDSQLPSTLTRGRVLEVSTGIVRIETPEGIWRCGLRGHLSQKETGFLNVIAVGDWVLAESDGHGGGVITEVLPRYNQLARNDSWYRHKMQVLAANVDQLLIVSAWQSPQLWSSFIDRCLITAERFNIKPIICINKMDLIMRTRQLDDYRLPYEALGYQVLLTSVVNGRGLEELKGLLAGKVTVLTGMSGVGKSSLLTTLRPDFQLKTSEVSEGSGEGRHTTTQSLMLPFGDGYVIDTPGVREFGLAGLTKEEVIGFYPDLQPYAAQCRFSNCTHFHEPNCAVRDAAEKGNLPIWRYEDYQDIFMAVE